MNNAVQHVPSRALVAAAATDKRSSDAPFLSIALINNMPDAAIAATERQFLNLLSAASSGVLVNLKCYSIPGIPRGEAAAAHISRYYENFAELTLDPPDGIIVTGTEPKAKNLKEEPYWQALSSVIDWAEDNAIPSIWSCLAAHAAVLHMDGIERSLGATKLSGLFTCRLAAHKHHITRGVPGVWQVPHSRHYGLRERDLASCGYSILSRANDVGADIFVRQGNALQLFFQGHPEYGPTTLLAEYERDMGRYLAGTRAVRPNMPRGYSVPANSAAMADAIGRQDPGPGSGRPEGAWAPVARRIYGNWISYLCDRRTYRLMDTSLAAFPAEPGALHASRYEAAP